MRVTITARHCEVPAELRERARDLLDRLSKVAARPHDAQVIFGTDHGTPTVELRLHTARSKVHVGTADGADHRSALDRALAKLRRQLDKRPVRRARSAARDAR